MDRRSVIDISFIAYYLDWYYEFLNIIFISKTNQYKISIRLSLDSTLQNKGLGATLK